MKIRLRDRFFYSEQVYDDALSTAYRPEIGRLVDSS